MSSPNPLYNAGILSFVTFRLCLFLLCALLSQTTQVLGQDDCPTLPCSVSFAIYSPAPPPLPPGPSSSRPNPLKTTSTSTSSSFSTSASSTSSQLPPSTLRNPSSSSSSFSSVISPSAVSFGSSSLPFPSSFTSSLSSTLIKTGTTTIVSSNSPPSISTPNVSSTGVQPSQLQSVSASPLSSTQIRLPLFSTTSSFFPSITQAPNFNSSSTNGTSSQCGQCSVMADQVRVYYWPTASVRSDCPRASAAVSDEGGPKYVANATTNATQTLTALASAGATDVINGFTYSFPSTYVSVVGKIQVSNSCGTFGKAYTNPPPVAVRAITTVSYASWPSECRPQGNYVDAVIDTLNIVDIACPTWGLSDPFYTSCSGETYLTATEGPPYNPVILVPTEFLGYDPSWGQCTKVLSNKPFLLPCGVYDPPRTLQPGGPLGAAQTPITDLPAPNLHTPAPGLVPSPNAAQPTVVPQPPQPPKPPNGDPPSSPNSGNTGSGGQSQSNPNQSNPGSGSTGGPPNDPASNQGTGSGSSSSGGSDNHGANPQPAPGPEHQGANPEPQPVPQTTINIGGQPAGGVGGIINNAFGASPPQGTSQSEGNQGSSGGSVGTNPGANTGGSSGGKPNNNNQGNGPANAGVFTPHAITALGATLSALNPTAVAIGGKTLSAGGPAFTTDNNFYSLAPSGNLVAGTLAPGRSPGTAPAALTFGGQTYTANSAGQFIIDGQTLAPGKAITISGTSISEAVGGSFAVIGSGIGSTQALITPAPSAGPALLTFGGSTYTANAASQFVIGSQTLTPGGQITVSGTVLSEGASGSGVVVIGGSSTQALAHEGGAAAATITSAAVLTFDGQTFTADALGDFTIDGQTLTPGGVINVSGTPISEDKGATDVVIGTSTEVLSTVAVTDGAMAFEGRGQKMKNTPGYLWLFTFIGLLIGTRDAGLLL